MARASRQQGRVACQLLRPDKVPAHIFMVQRGDGDLSARGDVPGDDGQERRCKLCFGQLGEARQPPATGKRLANRSRTTRVLSGRVQRLWGCAVSREAMQKTGCRWPLPLVGLGDGRHLSFALDERARHKVRSELVAPSLAIALAMLT